MRYSIKTIQVKLEVHEAIGHITSPSTTAPILRELFKGLDQDQEHFIILALDVKNQVIGYKVCASGGQDHVSIDFKVVFRNALLLGACALILSHNHPSGHPEPSNEDNRLTEEMQKACELLNIKFLDHIIIGQGTGTYFSYADKRLI